MDLVVVIAMNDPYVMSAWAKANEVKNDNIVGDRSFDAGFEEECWS